MVEVEQRTSTDEVHRRRLIETNKSLNLYKKMNDRTAILNQSVGAKTNSQNGNFLGSITGIMYDSVGEDLEYIVLKSKEFFGRGERFFAIPAKSPFIHITDEGKVTIHLNKDDLQFARGIPADNCPEPSLEYGLSVFELYNYDENQSETFTTKMLNRKHE